MVINHFEVKEFGLCVWAHLLQTNRANVDPTNHGEEQNHHSQYQWRFLWSFDDQCVLQNKQFIYIYISKNHFNFLYFSFLFFSSEKKTEEKIKLKIGIQIAEREIRSVLWVVPSRNLHERKEKKEEEERRRREKNERKERNLKVGVTFVVTQSLYKRRNIWREKWSDNGLY